MCHNRVAKCCWCVDTVAKISIASNYSTRFWRMKDCVAILTAFIRASWRKISSEWSSESRRPDNVITTFEFYSFHSFSDTLEFNTSDAAANDWTPERSFPSMNYEENKRSYPRPAVGTGSRLGLFIALYANLKEYYCSSTSSYGFKLLLHSPIESPKIAHFGMALSIGYETQMLVTPVISQASNRIRRVPTAVRQCLFENETDLSYYRWMCT